MKKDKTMIDKILNFIIIVGVVGYAIFSIFLLANIHTNNDIFSKKFWDISVLKNLFKKPK